MSAQSVPPFTPPLPPPPAPAVGGNGLAPSPRKSSARRVPAPVGLPQLPGSISDAASAAAAPTKSRGRLIRTKTMSSSVLKGLRNDVVSLHGSASSDTSLVDKAKAAFLAQENETPSGVMHPEGHARIFWDVLQVAALCYVALTVPLNIGFDISTKPDEMIFWVDVTVDLYFIIDICVNFRTAYFDRCSTDRILLGPSWRLSWPSPECSFVFLQLSALCSLGELVVAKKLIATAYLKGFFIIDFISSLPISYIMLMIEPAGGNDKSLRGFRLLRLIKLTKLLRCARSSCMLAPSREQARKKQAESNSSGSDFMGAGSNAKVGEVQVHCQAFR